MVGVSCSRQTISEVRKSPHPAKWSRAGLENRPAATLLNPSSGVPYSDLPLKVKV
jgi:hypothetical protein